jgi:hypothetical protein
MTRIAVTTLTLATAVLVTLTATPATAEDPESTFLEAVTEGTFKLNLRYRYEDVDQDGFDKRGQASTLRTMAGYRTGTWKGLEVYLEFEDIRDIGFANDHNNAGAGSLWNEVTDRPVIPDAPVTEVNQAYLGWSPIKPLPFRIGLQEINIDNHRFIGNVLWRQNHQSFEAARVAFNGVKNLKLDFSYIGRQHNVLGGSQPMDTMHLGAAYSFKKIGTLKGYAFILDYEREAVVPLNTATFGAFFDGNTKLSDTLKLAYRFEYANQSDANNPNRIDANYLRADLGLTVSKVAFGIGYEVLGGSAEDGQFKTPLATLHKFNGWADKFLATPTNGLQDLFLSVTANLGAFKLIGVYHDFSADTGGDKWGTELDAAVIYNSPWKQQFALKFADYNAKDHATDTRKLWIWTSWGF